MNIESYDDPLCYTKRDEFTSEVFKIEVGGLPKPIGFSQLKKLFNQKLQLKSHKIKTIGPQANWAFVTFKSEEDRERALTLLDGYQWRGRTLSAKKANPAADPLIRKRRNADAQSDSTHVNKNLKLESCEEVPNLAEQVLNVVMPLWKIPYEEQLKMKDTEVRKLLGKLGRQIEKTFRAVPLWLQENRKKYQFMCCEYEGLKNSPVVDRYRNKCEFTVGMNPAGEKRIVGFRLTRYSAGSMFVGEPTDCTIIPEAVLNVAKVFQSYVEQSDKIPYNPIDHSGFWKQLTVRYTTQGHLMAIVVMHPQKLDQDGILKVKEELRHYFYEGDGKDCGVTSLYYQSLAKKTADSDVNYEHVAGEMFITEKIMDFNFRISPDAFFQINTAAANTLYKTIGDIANVNEKTVLLDICCGTGAIGISLANKVNKVIGIELVANAIEDAKFNAEANGLKNTEFICGKVEQCLIPILYRFSSEEIVAIVDPPRAGLHNKVVRSIRACKALQRLVYVACDLAAASINLVDFCRPESNQYHGKPFTIKKAIAVDLFPHTNHCELVLLLQRTSTPVTNTDDAKVTSTGEAKVTSTDEENVTSTDEAKVTNSDNAKVTSTDDAIAI